MAVETNPEAIRPTSTGAVIPDLTPTTMGITDDNSSTHTVHPEESVTFSNPAADTSSTGAVVPPDAVTFSNAAYANPQPRLAAEMDEPAEKPEVETKVVRATPKAEPKRSKPAETK